MSVVGSRYVRGCNSEGVCSHTDAELKARETGCLMLFDLATGAIAYRPQGQVVNLIEPGAPPECPAVQRLEPRYLADRARRALQQ